MKYIIECQADDRDTYTAAYISGELVTIDGNTNSFLVDGVEVQFVDEIVCAKGDEEEDAIFPS